MTDDPNLRGEEPLPEDQQLADEEVVEHEAPEPGGPEPAEGAFAAGALEGDALEDDTREGETRVLRPDHEARAAAASRASRRAVVVDPSLRIRDRVSQLFVVGTVLVFALIFLNALAFGHGGAFSPTPTPAPSVDLGSFAPLPTESPSPAPIQTPFNVPTHSPAPGASVEPAAS